MKRIYFVMMFIVCAMPLWASCSTDDTEPLPEPKPLVPSGNTKTLVAYYSATGNTHAVAMRIAELTGCIVKNPKAAGYCYTQLTDIEQEQNGIYNYDRTPKFDAETIHNIFSMKPSWSKL